MTATRQLVMKGEGWVVSRQNADITDTLYLRDVAMATTLTFYIWGAHWRHLANTTEPSLCSGDTALCQITLSTIIIALRNLLSL